MKTLSNVSVGTVALLLIGFLTMEMFFWTTPFVRERFGLTLEQATLMAPLAANIGLYNGLLAAGLVWGPLIHRDDGAIKVFFLACAIAAGIYGVITIQLSILFFQAIPAILAVLLVWIGHRGSENIRVVRN